MTCPPKNVTTLYMTCQRMRILSTLRSARYPLNHLVIAKMADVRYETAYWSLRRFKQWGWVEVEEMKGLSGSPRFYQLSAAGRLETDHLFDPQPSDRPRST